MIDNSNLNGRGGGGREARTTTTTYRFSNMGHAEILVYAHRVYAEVSSYSCSEARWSGGLFKTSANIFEFYSRVHATPGCQDRAVSVVSGYGLDI